MKTTQVFKKTTWLVVCLTALLVAGCDNEYRTIIRVDGVCDKSTINERAAFILQCIGNANPKSDEEPEDWITKCKDMAVATYCERKTVKVEQWLSPGSYWKDQTVTVVGN